MKEREEAERAAIAAEVLDAWGTAIRMDWATIDGRSCRSQLEEISAYLRGIKDTLTAFEVGVCIHGVSPEWGECEKCYEETAEPRS